MKPLPKFRRQHGRAMKQRGVVLFFALIALVVMSLAAVALIRSVDTNTLIAGNLAFKQSTATSGDAGTEAAMIWLTATQAANTANSAYTNLPAAHAFNVDAAASGYYSNVDPNLSLTTSGVWNAITTVPAVIDASGNTVQYVIQRMCRTANQVLSTTNCLFSSATVNNNGQTIPLPQEVCTGSGCPVAGQSPEYRITARITGYRNTVSYIQAFVY